VSKNKSESKNKK
jgi:Copine